MSFSSVPTVANGDSWSAAQHNTYLRDNMAALFPYTTNGDMAYRSGAGVLSRLALGAAYKLLRVNAGATNPEYGQAPFVVETHSHAVGYTYSTNAWRDAPNSSATIILLVQSTIVVFGVIVAYGGSTYGFRKWKWNIGGTDVDDMITHLSYDINQWNASPIIGYKTGVTSGNKTIKLREICEAGDFTVDRLQWIAIAIPDQ